MTNQHYELRLAIACYLLTDTEVVIPPQHHNHIVNAYNHGNKIWDTDNAAALTLLSAYYDNAIQLSDLSYPGKVALQWAEKHSDGLSVQ